nr:Gag-Pol polyprotein [Tanacetum cinerariifolium]
MALGYPNPSYLKKAQLKQQSLYNGNLLLVEHDPPAMYDSEKTLELAQESHEKIIISHEITPIIDQDDARVQNFEIQFLQEAVTFVQDFKSLAKEADESLDKQKSLELEIERLLKASVSHDIMSIVERLQAQLRDLKGKSSDTRSASNTLDPLNQKLESKIVELEFQVVNYEREISHIKITYKNLFDSIKSNRAHAKLHDLIYENAQLRDRGFENTLQALGQIRSLTLTIKEKGSADTVTTSSTGLVHTART